MAIDTVVVSRALRGDVVASIGNGAPSRAAEVGQAVAAVVIGGATRGHFGAHVLGSAPGVASVAHASSSNAIVFIGANGRASVARVCCCAEAVARKEGQTISAAVAGIATNRDLNARGTLHAPALAGRA